MEESHVTKLEEMVDTISQRVLSADTRFAGVEGPGASHYLRTLKGSYVRTLRDLCELRTEGLLRGQRLLELGAFFGVVSLSLRQLGFTVTAHDIPVYAENKTMKRLFGDAGIASVVAWLGEERLPLPDGAFDGVVMCEVIEHLPTNPLPVLADIHRVLAPGGVLYLAQPNMMSARNWMKWLRGRSHHNPVTELLAQIDPQQDMSMALHWREYTRREAEELLATAGFSVVRKSFFDIRPPDPPANLFRVARRVAYRTLVRLLPFFASSQVVVAVKSGAPDPRASSWAASHLRASAVSAP